MIAYIIRRVLLLIPTLLLVSLLVFFPIRLLPGDVIQLMVAQYQYAFFQAGKTSEESIELLKKELGLDVSVYVQYGRWMGVLPNAEGRFDGLLQGNLGKSLWSRRPVTEAIFPRIPVTLELGIMAIIIAQVIALPLGMYSAIRKNTLIDYIGRSIAIASYAVPSFWLGIMIMVFPALWWDWSPPMMYVPFFKDPIGNLRILMIPSILLGMPMSGVTMRLMRTMMLEVLRQDYIRTAWSKGLTERVVVIRHALKNAMIPVVTMVGMQVALLLAGAVVIETIFSLPGMGRLMIIVLNQRDYTMLAGINMLIAFTVVVVNLIVDLTYAYLDPRIQYT
jgi:peptide/nickel transport system permease protein